MDFSLLVQNASSKTLAAAQKVLIRRKPFLTVYGTQHNELFAIPLILKCVFAGYGTRRVNPGIATVLFMLCVIVCIHFFIDDTSWPAIAAQILYSTAQTVIHFRDMPFSYVVWYIYGFSYEFFLDCYVTMTLFFYVWREYAAKPDKFCGLICGLYIGNSILNFVIGHAGFSISANLLLYYVPMILLSPLDFRYGALCAYIWMLAKLTQLSFESPVLKFLMHIQGKNLVDVLDEFNARKAFLNVDENSHCIVFFFLQLLKSFIAGYAATEVAGLRVMLISLLANFCLTFFDRSFTRVISCLLRLVANVAHLGYFIKRKYPVYGCDLFWIFLTFHNDHYHFFLDCFLVVSAFIYVYEVYTGGEHQISPLVCALFFVEWLSDALVGNPLKWTVTAITLHFPVILIRTTAALRSRSRLPMIAAFISLWLVFKHWSFFECYVDEYLQLLLGVLND